MNVAHTGNAQQALHDHVVERVQIGRQDLQYEIMLAGDGVTPVLCCWERRWQIETGRAWCHRHLVAAWLKGELGIEVAEL